MKKEVKILGLSYAQSSSGSYIVILSEKEGKKKLPIIIKPSDAQMIAIKIEGVKSPRPLTHDLFKSLTDIFSIDVAEVYIYSVLEGIFYTKILITNGVEDFEIECTAGDGIALSLVYNCHLYVSKEVLDISGIYVNEDGSTPTDEEIKKMEEEDNIDNYNAQENEEDKRFISIEDLEHMMEDAIANEEYEIAAEIRDRIEYLKNGDS